MKTYRYRIHLVVLVLLTVQPLSGRSIDPVPASSRDLQTLLTSPEVIELSTARDGLRPQSTLAIYGYVHGVYPVPRSAFLAVLENIDAYHEFVPNMAESELVRQISVGEALHRTLLRFRVVFFRAEFDTVSRTRIEELGPTSTAVYIAFEESRDGRISHMAGSWFLETVFLGGREHTYVRYRLWTEYADPIVGQAQATRSFGPRQLGDLLNAYGERVQDTL
ncbi:MAG: hypothetical protein ACOC4F_03300 [bacterium]